MSHHSNKRKADLKSLHLKKKVIDISAISIKSSELQNNQILEQNKKCLWVMISQK